MKAEILKQVNRIRFGVKRNSSEICTGVGIALSILSLGSAIKATTKLESIQRETREKLDTIREVQESRVYEDEYTEEDAKKDTVLVRVQSGIKIVKNYMPSVFLEAAAITCFLASNNICRKRLIALTAAYSALNREFDKYRNRVLDRFGKEVEQELKYGVRNEEVEEKVTDDKGKEKTIKKNVQVVDDNNYSPFAKFFDASSREWEDNAQYNLQFLSAQQAAFNDILKSRGYVFLNEVYRALDIPETKSGQMFGWVYDPGNPEHTGDNFIDFGIHDGYHVANREFVNGYEPVILLDFNVDGPILSTFEKYER